MLKEIKVGEKVITYEEAVFSTDCKPLNITVATTALLEINEILKARQVDFYLMYGTLLGCVREKGFILHDTDVDLAVLEENKFALLHSLPEILKAGFVVGRYDGKLLSIMRDDIYIDFYFFRPSLIHGRISDVGLTAKSRYFKKTKEVEFLGGLFLIPEDANGLLVDLYGENWRTPIKNDPSMNHNSYIIFREKVKKRLPFIFKLVRPIKRLINKFI